MTIPRHSDPRPSPPARDTLPRLLRLPAGLTALGAGAAVLVTLLWTPRPAAAQCDDPDAVFCAEVRIGARRAPARRAQQPQVVVVQPAPPPPPPPPRPRVVVVQPAPPPPPPPPRRQVVVVRSETTRVVTPAPTPAPRLRYPDSTVGVRLFFGGAAIPDGGMGGGGAALRLRPADHLGIDLGVGLYGGRDSQERLRGEVPVTADLRFVFNGRRRFQVYGILGGGVSFASVEEAPGLDREFVHLGGSAGLGMEFFPSRYFSLSWDVRAFLRQAVSSSDGEPEFVDADTNEQTDTSAGGLFTFGATFYFR